MNNLYLQQILEFHLKGTDGHFGISKIIHEHVGNVLLFHNDKIICIDLDNLTNPFDIETLAPHVKNAKLPPLPSNTMMNFVFDKLDVTQNEIVKILTDKQVGSRAPGLRNLAAHVQPHVSWVFQSVIIQEYPPPSPPPPPPPPPPLLKYTRACYAILNLFIIINNIMIHICDTDSIAPPKEELLLGCYAVSAPATAAATAAAPEPESAAAPAIDYYLDFLRTEAEDTTTRDVTLDVIKYLFNKCVVMIANSILPGTSPMLTKIKKKCTEFRGKDGFSVGGFASLNDDFILSSMPIIRIKSGKWGVSTLFSHDKGIFIFKNMTLSLTDPCYQTSMLRIGSTIGDSLHDFGGDSNKRKENLPEIMKPYIEWWGDHMSKIIKAWQTHSRKPLITTEWTSESQMKTDLKKYFNEDAPWLSNLNTPLTNKVRRKTLVTSNGALAGDVKSYNGEALTVAQIIDAAPQMGDPKKTNEAIVINEVDMKRVSNGKVDKISMSQPFLRIKVIMGNIMKYLMGGGATASAPEPVWTDPSDFNSHVLYKLNNSANPVKLTDTGYDLIIEDINTEITNDVTHKLHGGKLFYRTIIKYIILQSRKRTVVDTNDTNGIQIGFRLIITEYTVEFGKIWLGGGEVDGDDATGWTADYLTGLYTKDGKYHRFRKARSLDGDLTTLTRDGEATYIKSLLKMLFPNKNIDEFLLLEGCSQFTSAGIVLNNMIANGDSSIEALISGQSLKLTGDENQEHNYALQELVGHPIAKLNNDITSAFRDLLNAYTVYNGPFTFNEKVVAQPLIKIHEQKKDGKIGLSFYYPPSITPHEYGNGAVTLTNLTGGGQSNKKNNKIMIGGSTRIRRVMELHLKDYLIESCYYDDPRYISTKLNFKGEAVETYIINKLLNSHTVHRGLTEIESITCLCDYNIGPILFSYFKELYEKHLTSILNFKEEEELARQSTTVGSSSKPRSTTVGSSSKPQRKGSRKSGRKDSIKPGRKDSIKRTNTFVGDGGGKKKHNNKSKKSRNKYRRKIKTRKNKNNNRRKNKRSKRYTKRTVRKTRRTIKIKRSRNKNSR